MIVGLDPFWRVTRVLMHCARCGQSCTTPREGVECWARTHLAPTLVGVDVVLPDGTESSWRLSEDQWPPALTVQALDG